MRPSHSDISAFRLKQSIIRVALIALLLVSMPCGALAQSDHDWVLCKAHDADHLAIPACTRLIEANDLAQRDRAIAYNHRATARWRQRDFDEAIADANAALDIDPSFSDALVIRGAAYGSKEDDERALANSSKAIDIDPNNDAAYSNRGIARANKGDLDGAIADATRAIEINPEIRHGLHCARDSLCEKARAWERVRGLRQGDRHRASRRIRRLPASRRCIPAQGRLRPCHR